MALMTCLDCKTEMSDKAKACPKCGWIPFSQSDEKLAEKAKGGNATLFACIGFVLGFCLFWGGCGRFESMNGQGFMIGGICGGIIGLLGGLLGALMDKKS